jgi:aminotransferase
MILHYGGDPADVDPIVKLLADRGIPLIEDSACSVASRYKGRACGTLGDFGAWSFDSMKILVTGDGGAIYAKDPSRIGLLTDRLYLGMGVKSGLSAAKDADRWWEFEISSFGRRAIMNDMTSAIGLVQLQKLRSFIERRSQIRAKYDHAFSGLNWLSTPLKVLPGCESSNYLYWVQVGAGTRDGLAKSLKGSGIYTTFRYYPLHRVKRYGSTADLPGADAAADTTLCLPIHQGLSDADVTQVIDSVIAFGGSL